MLSRILRRNLPVLVLLTGLSLPPTPASAFPLPTRVPSHRSSESLGSSVWAWLFHHFQVILEKNGMAIDPDGQPILEKNGMTIDPDGLYVTTEPPGPHGDNEPISHPNG